MLLSLNLPYPAIVPAVRNEAKDWHWIFQSSTQFVWEKLGRLWNDLRFHHTAACCHRASITDLGEEYCWYSLVPVDEHYFPSLIAYLQLGHETDCIGGLVSADWRHGGSHPRTYKTSEVTVRLWVTLALAEGWEWRKLCKGTDSKNGTMHPYLTLMEPCCAASIASGIKEDDVTLGRSHG